MFKLILDKVKLSGYLFRINQFKKKSILLYKLASSKNLNLMISEETTMMVAFALYELNEWKLFNWRQRMVQESGEGELFSELFSVDKHWLLHSLRIV